MPPQTGQKDGRKGGQNLPATNGGSIRLKSKNCLLPDHGPEKFVTSG